MQNLSLQKRSFFNSIGLDTKNMPTELKNKAENLNDEIPTEDTIFFKNKNLVTSEKKHFGLKNLVGTANKENIGKSWVQILVDDNKSDEMIKKYFDNPNYYFKDLKKIDSTELSDNDIELYDDNGKLYVKKGTDKLALMMTKYLLESSRAQSKEEQQLINKKYIFAGNILTPPKDRDEVYMINMLANNYGEKLKIKKATNDNQCKYIFNYGTQTIKVNDKRELETFVKNSYFPKTFKTKAKLKNKLDNFVKIGTAYKNDEKYEDAFLVMGKIFPNYEMFVKYYQKAQQYNLNDKVIADTELNNVTYDVFLQELIRCVKEEEKSKKKEQEKSEKNKKIIKAEEKLKKQDEEEKRRIKEQEKIIAEQEKAQQEKIEKEMQQEKQKKIEVQRQKKLEGKKKKEIAEQIENELIEFKACMNKRAKSIIDDIETTYYKLNSEESKYFELAGNVDVTLNIDKINENKINSSINNIKEYMININKKIDSAKKIEELKDLNESLKDTKKIINCKKIVDEYSDEMSTIFKTCFNKKVQKLITESKIKKLDMQKEEIESEKCSFFSRLLGKNKLKQAKLDNIDLKKQLVISESQYISRSFYYLEDGLSEIYTYMRDETDESCLGDINYFLKNIESNREFNNMIDQDKLNEIVQEKLNRKDNLPQLSLNKEKHSFFSKKQINLVEEKNNELKRVIQITRANSLKLQNTGLLPILGNISSTKAITRFYNDLVKVKENLRAQI